MKEWPFLQTTVRANVYRGECSPAKAAKTSFQLPGLHTGWFRDIMSDMPGSMYLIAALEFGKHSVIHPLGQPSIHLTSLYSTWTKRTTKKTRKEHWYRGSKMLKRKFWTLLHKRVVLLLLLWARLSPSHLIRYWNQTSSATSILMDHNLCSHLKWNSRWSLFVVITGNEKPHTTYAHTPIAERFSVDQELESSTATS